jgi:hypothetical protein
LLFAVTLFVSAFILFLVQPIIGKLILPKLGGTPQVWNTCMVFFQMVLLLGYFYTHAVSTRLKPRQQLILHSCLLVLPFIVLWPGLGLLNKFAPFDYITKVWVPTNLGSNPIFSALFLLSLVVGIPFFVVSTSAPLLQKWFGYTGHPAAKDPYFLYGASNLGSMLSLILYPMLFEPFLTLDGQGWAYFVGYAGLVVCFIACVAMVWNPTGRYAPIVDAPDRPMEPPVPPTSGETGITAAPAKHTGIAKSAAIKAAARAGATDVAIRTGEHAPMTMMRRLRWVALAFVPSSMMLGVTSHITTDLSPIPLFWLVPLAIYLLSFILVFAKWPVEWVDVPHKICLFLQPLAIAFMLVADYIPSGDDPHEQKSFWMPIVANVLAFTLSALVMHGELAKDRPSTRYLTDFYLMMSVGGVLGGIFNGLLAPLIPYVIELNIAIMAACLLRPVIQNPLGTVLDEFVGGGAEAAPARGVKGGPTSPRSLDNVSMVLDWVVPAVIVILCAFLVMIGAGGTKRSGVLSPEGVMVSFGLPLFLACLFLFRPLRFGLAVVGIICVYEFYTDRQLTNTLQLRDRSYFSVIRVMQYPLGGFGKEGIERLQYRSLTHGHILHGQNFLPGEPDRGLPDYTRLATTYYHRLGPVGIVMEKFNWFHVKDDSLDVRAPTGLYRDSQPYADARMPAAIVGLGASTGMVAADQMVNLWSEPPFATIGLGTGTMGSYARPFQHCHFYEIDHKVRRLSLSDYEYYNYGKAADQRSSAFAKNKIYFHFLRDAVERGADIQVLMGDARLRMDMPYKNYGQDQERGGGPEDFYHMMVVDAFTSDAIPVHLLTKQAIKMYFKHLAKEGILCFHTSNRYVNLPVVIATTVDAITDEADAAEAAFKEGKELTEAQKEARAFGRLYHRRIHDSFDRREGTDRATQRSSSEWVMVARDENLLTKGKYSLQALLNVGGNRREITMNRVDARDKKYIWTDDYHNLLFAMNEWVGRDR